MSGLDKREEKLVVGWYMDCVRRNTVQMCAVAHNGVRLAELVLWHSTLAGMVGRPLSRVHVCHHRRCDNMGRRASATRHLAQLHVAAT